MTLPIILGCAVAIFAGYLSHREEKKKNKSYTLGSMVMIGAVIVCIVGIFIL